MRDAGLTAYVSCLLLQLMGVIFDEVLKRYGLPTITEACRRWPPYALVIFGAIATGMWGLCQHLWGPKNGP